MQLSLWSRPVDGCPPHVENESIVAFDDAALGSLLRMVRDRDGVESALITAFVHGYQLGYVSGSKKNGLDST